MNLRQAARADLAAARGRELAVVTLLAAWLVFQWGFGNDALLPPIVANVADALDDGETAPAGIAAVMGGATAGGAFWALAMTIDGIVMATGLRHLPNLVATVGARLRAKGWVSNWDEMRWSTRWMLAYGAGASAVVLADALARDGSVDEALSELSSPSPGDARRHRRIIVASVVLSAGSVTLVAATIVGAAIIARRFPATAPTADVIVRVARNPLFWIGLFATIWAVQGARARRVGVSDDAD